MKSTDSYLVIDMKCVLCGNSIKPWFETCFECHQIEKQKGCGRFSEEIKAGDFMKQMGIGHW